MKEPWHFDFDILENIVNYLHDGLYFVDKDRVITYWNRAAEKITGFTSAEVLGHSCADNILTHIDAEGRSLCLGLCPLAAAIDDGQPRETNVYLHHKDGHRVPVHVRVSAIKDNNGVITGGVELFTDISNLEANELRVKELERLALLDHLTQLANRTYLEKEFLSRLAEMRRMDIPFGVLLMDVDHFKQVNDTYGHDAGDRVLQYLAGTLVSNARPFDLYGRWGGEEFLALFRNVGAKELADIGERIRFLVENSYTVYGDTRLSVTVSAGATLARPDDTMESIVKRADKLLYECKHAGRNCLRIG